MAGVRSRLREKTEGEQGRSVSTHILETSMSLPLPREVAFAFFADAANPKRITPPQTRSRILAPGSDAAGNPDRLRAAPVRGPVGPAGAYRAPREPPPVGFVDEERVRGPYRLRGHAHRSCERGGRHRGGRSLPAAVGAARRSLPAAVGALATGEDLAVSEIGRTPPPPPPPPPPPRDGRSMGARGSRMLHVGEEGEQQRGGARFVFGTRGAVRSSGRPARVTRCLTVKEPIIIPAAKPCLEGSGN